MPYNINRIEEGNKLLKSYQHGNEESLKQLIRIIHPKMEKVIRSSVMNNSVVEDLIQECWYAIIPQLKTLRIEISFQAWALSIARRKAIDWIRTQQKQRIIKRSAASEVEESIYIDSSDIMLKKLEKVKYEIEKLPESQKIVLKLFYIENLSLSEVSDVLGISKGTVKSRLFNSRESLKKNVT